MMNILITYPDKTAEVRSLEDQFEHFKDETSGFKALFYWNVLRLGKEFITRFATYSLTDLSITI